MLDKSSKFDMQMRREPMMGLKLLQKFSARRAPQAVVVHIVLQKRLSPQKSVQVSVVVDTVWPIVGHDDVDWLRQLEWKRIIDYIGVNSGGPSSSQENLLKTQ